MLFSTFVLLTCIDVLRLFVVQMHMVHANNDDCSNHNSNNLILLEPHHQPTAENRYSIGFRQYSRRENGRSDRNTSHHIARQAVVYSMHVPSVLSKNPTVRLLTSNIVDKTFPVISPARWFEKTMIQLRLGDSLIHRDASTEGKSH